MRFQNKVVLITGGSSGIGASTALLFAKDGAKVVIVGRNEDKLKKVQETNPNKIMVIKADVSKDEDAQTIVKQTIERHGKIDILVNNAGILRNATILGGNLFNTFDEVMNTNLRAAVYITSLTAPHLVKTKGNIVFVSSVLGKSAIGITIFPSYMTSKAGLDHFARSTALELGAHGVRVNTVSPGPVATDILDQSGLEFKMEIQASATILNRISQPEEVARVIAFLASDDAVSITGSDFVMDNGLLLKGSLSLG